MSILSTYEKHEFMRAGFLTVPDVIEEPLLEDWRTAVWEDIPVDRDADPVGYLGEDSQGDWKDLDWGPLRDVHERVIPYVEALLGEENIADPEGQFQHAIRFPDQKKKVQRPSDLNGHIDGYGGGAYHDSVRGNSLHVAIYIDRVEPRGGGFTVWPGSHWKAAGYWKNHPDLSFTDYFVEHDRPPFEVGEPYEISADGGTLILWHGKLAHTAGVHHTLRPRMAAFRRHRHASYAENHLDSIKHPFKYWEGTDGIELDDFEQPRYSGLVNP